GQIIRHYPRAEGSGTWGFAVSPDGHTALSAWWVSKQPNNVILWDLNTGAEIRRYSGDEFINTIAFSPDGQTALLGVDPSNGAPSDVILLDVNTAKEIRRFKGHQAGVRNLGFFPDGRTAFSNDWKGVTILWDVATGTEIRHFSGDEADGHITV